MGDRISCGEEAVRYPSVTLVCGWPDLSDYGLSVLAIGYDLVSDFSAMHLDRSRKFKRHSHSVPLDRRDAHDTLRGGGIPNDDFFAFSSGDD